MSHWNLDGNGPDYRYSQAGGLDSSSENVYQYKRWYDDGSPAPIEDWTSVIAGAEESLMGSEGHRKNILSPEHTGVGIGIAYNETTGEVAIDQLFVNHYAKLWPLPLQATVGERLTIKGRLEPGVSNPVLHLAYEKFPESMTVEELNQTETYIPPTDEYDALLVEPREDGLFEQAFTLNHEGRPGLYHVLLVVDTEDYDLILASNIVIEVH